MGWRSQVAHNNHTDSPKHIKRCSASHRCGACSLLGHVFLFHPWNFYTVRHDHSLRVVQVVIKRLAVNRCAKLDWHDGSALKPRREATAHAGQQPVHKDARGSLRTLTRPSTDRVHHRGACPSLPCSDTGFSVSTGTASSRGAGVLGTRALLHRPLQLHCLGIVSVLNSCLAATGAIRRWARQHSFPLSLDRPQRTFPARKR